MNRQEKRRRVAAKATADRGASALLPLVAGAVVVLGLAGAYVWTLGGMAPPSSGIGGHWSLTNAAGERVTDRDFRGRYVLLYFGYTDCPDICPTTLSAVAEALHLLGRRADRLQPVFITVDPDHDTPTVIGDYTRMFSARLIGLTGTPAEIATVEREYHVESRAAVGKSSHGASLIDHTAVLLLIGRDGRFIAPLAPDESGQEIASRLDRYVS